LETKVEIVLKKSAVSIVTVQVGQKMLSHEKSNLLILFGASFCPNVAFCSMSKALVTVPTLRDKLWAMCTVQMWMVSN